MSRNEKLRDAILQIWPSVAAFCKDQNFHPTRVGLLINLKMLPVNQNGKYKAICIRLSEALGISVSELFPPKLYGERINRPILFSELNDENIENIQAERSPEDLVGAAELGESTRRALARLAPREEKVLRLRFGIGESNDHKLQEAGDNFYAARELIRQIEAKALRKLRHPSRQKILRDLDK